MAHVIAIAGKGGVGKTTLTGLIIQYLGKKGKGPILAVDADANSNLNEVLGVEVEETLGDIREEVARAEMSKDNPIPPGVSKADYMEFKFDDALIEDDDYDLLVMGRREKDVTVLLTDFCRRSFRGWKKTILISSWIMKPAWSISAEEFFRIWRLPFLSVTVQEEAYRQLEELHS